MAGGFMLVVVLAAVVVCMLAVGRLVRLRRLGSDQDWFPPELRGAELLWSEKAFRSDGPVRIAVRIDRAYRLAGGVIALVEFKRRAQRRVYLSDVVELSTQRYTLQQAGHIVSAQAYVVVTLPHGVRTRALPVALEDAQTVERRVLRLVALTKQRVSPDGPASPAICNGCGHRKACHRSPWSA